MSTPSDTEQRIVSSLRWIARMTTIIAVLAAIESCRMFFNFMMK